MKIPAIASAASIFLASGLASCTDQSDETAEVRGDHLVVVELFQSQGCSSCPPAVRHLNDLADRSDVLALSYAVTYWNNLGWKDSFAAPEFTQRQRDYGARYEGAGVATPQYWINGKTTVRGAQIERVEDLILDAEAISQPSIVSNGSTISIGTGSAPADGADVWLVRYDPSTIDVAIGAGENDGRTIPHQDIVRELTKIGQWNGKAGTFDVPAASDTSLKSAVLVQAGRGGPILSATKL